MLGDELEDRADNLQEFHVADGHVAGVHRFIDRRSDGHDQLRDVGIVVRSGGKLIEHLE